MTGPVIDFDANGFAGLPGALRSAAATFPVVWIGNEVVLRIARELEGARQAQDDLAQERAVRRMLQESVTRIANEVERRAMRSLWLGLACGGGLGAVVLAVLA